jgi:hypothetical protein
MRCLLTRAFPEATAKGLVTATTLDAEDPGISKHWFATGDLHNGLQSGQHEAKI